MRPRVGVGYQPSKAQKDCLYVFVPWLWCAGCNIKLSQTDVSPFFKVHFIYINKYINNLFVIRKYIFLYGTMIPHWIVKRKVIGLRTLGPIFSNNALRNIPSSSSELVGLTRSVRRKSVPTPWYPSLCHRTGWRSFLLTLFTVYISCFQQYRQELPS